MNRYTTDEPDRHRRLHARSGARACSRSSACGPCARDATSRDWKAALDAVACGAAARDNLVPPIIAAVEADATVGEIADTLRAVFGEYKEVALD